MKHAHCFATDSQYIKVLSEQIRHNMFTATLSKVTRRHHINNSLLIYSQ